jgi:hypothetical protein
MKVWPSNIFSRSFFLLFSLCSARFRFFYRVTRGMTVVLRETIRAARAHVLSGDPKAFSALVFRKGIPSTNL